MQYAVSAGLDLGYVYSLSTVRGYQVSGSQQARLPVTWFELATKGSLQIAERVRYQCATNAINAKDEVSCPEIMVFLFKPYQRVRLLNQNQKLGRNKIVIALFGIQR
ncbi:hypothetical protein PoB_000158100 [Plakobranchus ocellatus]|uniref:Uncharacterized protein n=1 Tax=Plakobranchus ocellatus TaxID=259542 RepID=A0AAV3XW92_9GAST|nr:hypothetical protein PoB_000158100 [Plakobranchus ocellatus]